MSDRRLGLSVGLVSAAALLLEFTFLRLLSVALWYPFAFVAIGTALLGMGTAALAFVLVARLQIAAPERVLRFGGCFFVATSIGFYPLWNVLGADPFSILIAPSQALRMLALLLLLASPFMGAGLFVARALSLRPRAAPLLYGADLGGAALGVLVYVLAMPLLGPGAIALAAGLGAFAIAALPGRRATRLALGLLGLGLFLGASSVQDLVPLEVTRHKDLLPRTRRPTTWTVGSAIDLVVRGQERLLLIDGGTAVSKLAYLEPKTTPAPPRGMRALAHVLGPSRSTLVVGSGGGVEVLAALGAGTARILGVEIDRAICRFARSELCGGLFCAPGVELACTEARSLLAQSRERFDAIVAFHTISNAASATGAMGLAENYLMTVEGVRSLLDHLTPDGVLVMSRPEAQLGRLVATMAAAWPDGGDPRAHLAVVAAEARRPSFLAAVVATRRVLTPADLELIRAEVPRIAYSPFGGGDSQAFFEDLLAGRDTARAALPYRPIASTPTTDDRPYFNLPVPWSAIGLSDVTKVFGAGARARERLEDLPMAQVATLVLVGILFLLALPLLIVVLIRTSAPAASRCMQWRVAIYFAALGMAFMLLELSLAQRLTRLVGMPAHALTAVVAVLLISSGAGSVWLAGRLSPWRAALGALVAALFVYVATPVAVELAAPWSGGARLLLAALLVAPIGLLLGTPFASALGRLRGTRLVALAFATNSMTSVLGSVTALVISSAFGLGTSALVAAACYLVAALALRTCERIPDRSGIRSQVLRAPLPDG